MSTTTTIETCPAVSYARRLQADLNALYHGDSTVNDVTVSMYTGFLLTAVWEFPFYDLSALEDLWEGFNVELELDYAAPLETRNAARDTLISYFRARGLKIQWDEATGPTGYIVSVEVYPSSFSF